MPWDHDSRDPWGSLRPRVVTRQVGADFECTEPMAGWVTTQTDRGERVVSFGDSALRAGVLIGRDARCEVVVPVQTVSRVHAVLLLLDDGLWVLDAGSTNGTWRLDEDLKIARVLEGDRLGLGHEASFGWRAAH